MKIKMGLSPRSPEAAAARYWAVSVIRAFGVLQVIGVAGASFAFLTPVLQIALHGALGLDYNGASMIASALAIILGVLVGMGCAAMTFAIAAAFDDLHTIRGYLRDMTITGQYYDE